MFFIPPLQKGRKREWEGSENVRWCPPWAARWQQFLGIYLRKEEEHDGEIEEQEGEGQIGSEGDNHEDERTETHQYGERLLSCGEESLHLFFGELMRLQQVK